MSGAMAPRLHADRTPKPAEGGGTAQVAKAHRVWLRHGGGTLHTCGGRRYCTGR